MNKTQEALKLALEALEENHHLIEEHERPEYLAQYDRVISSVAKELAEQPAQQREPFALLVRKHSWNKGQYECAPPNAPEYGRQWADERVWVYTSPPASKPWVGLSTIELDEIDAPIRERGHATIAEIYRAIEAKLREKNA